MDNPNYAPQTSLYSLAAIDGLWTGLMMGACVFFMVMSSMFAICSIVAVLLLILTPYIVWRFMRDAKVKNLIPETFSAVWLYGICVFLFGSIIMALFMYITLRFVQPDWIELEMTKAAIILAGDPSTADKSRIIETLIATGQLPSAINVAFSAIWLTSFTGSMWSMIFAWILTRFSRFRNKNR